MDINTPPRGIKRLANGDLQAEDMGVPHDERDEPWPGPGCTDDPAYARARARRAAQLDHEAYEALLVYERSGSDAHAA